jgi:LAO/AO transport system ATPase/phenylacetic acid degradation protein PaaD
VIPAGLLEGDRRVVARTISVVEQGRPGAAALGRALEAHLGRAHVVGITGPPGAGKSTLIHALLGELVAAGKRVAVVAVDPSSPLTGGAVLGDRVRMGTHGAHPSVFIRSVAARGHLGGLSSTTREIVDVLDAAGFDIVVVETVGTGQSEVEIMRVADTRVVSCAPGTGDNVQALKAGILEIADVLVVTKADLPTAAASVRDLKDMLHLRAADLHQEAVAVVAVSGTTGEGVASLVERIDAHRRHAGCGRRLAPRTPAARPAPEGEPSSGDAAALARLQRYVADDPFVRSLGIRLLEGGAGFIALALTVRPEHLNFQGACHGGVIFTLADAAFGLAANSHGQTAAGIDTHITYQRAAREGDVLVARAREITRAKRLGFYLVEVGTESHPVISTFTGTVHVKV